MYKRQELGWASAWVTAIIVAREFVVSGIRLIAAGSEKKTVIAASIWGKPVSYTHLQFLPQPDDLDHAFRLIAGQLQMVLQRHGSAVPVPCQSSIQNLQMLLTGPVSYTHLDVYKRQREGS